MNYRFEMLVSVTDVNLSMTDRHGHALPVDIPPQGNVIHLSTEICLPNEIVVAVQKTAPDGYVVLEEVRLGYIRFNKTALDNLFVYHHEYGMSRDTTWSFGGTANFSFFEFSAIKYHLLMKTKI